MAENKKILVNIQLEKLIKTINFEQFKNYSNDLLDDKLTKFVAKYKNIEHYLNALVLKVVVDNENKAVENFNARHIIFYYQIENIILLNKILISNSRYRNKEITLCFIIDDESNKYYNHIEDYAINFAKYESNKYNNHILFENSLHENPSFYVNNARKSVLNSLFNTNPRKPFRISNSTELIPIDSIKDTLRNKYLNLQCPICAKYSIELKSLKKNEITEETVNYFITIERNTSKISYNCLHVDLEIEKGKFFFTPAKYNVDINKYNDIELQNWTLKNFPYIIKKESNANN